MSADNYVVVRRFGKNDYRWGMWFMSDDIVDKSDEHFNHGPFNTPFEAADNAQNECVVIEYGISYERDCLKES